MHFDFQTWRRVIGLVGRDRLSPRRLAVQLGLLALLSGWAVFNAFFLALDRLLYPRLHEVPIEQPVFIVGNARSGTTLFHRLLCEDEERFVHFRTWELVFPSIAQKKGVRGLVTSFRRFFPATFQRLVAWESRLLPELRKQHPIALDKPEEDELLMLMSFSSVMLAILFPYVEQLPELMHFEHRPASVRSKLLDFYRGCVMRQLYYRQLYYAGGQRTLVSKNPAFVSKMRDLGREFPDAKFVYLVRNPFETVPSLIKLLRTMWEGLGVDEAHMESGTRGLLEGCIRDYFYALEVLDELPPERYAIVQYAELIADPKASVESVYRRLGLSISPAFEARLAAERSRQKRYHSSNAYSLEEYGIDPEELEEWLAPVLERFGFEQKKLSDEQTREML
ncbi:MAG: sulfotransferase [Deltaproteobacteria bacterium]|nr:sulfotransferase [Deltaproteobacteria bacterium]